ncbi:transmembrane protein 132E-like [Lytechinus pictus]|uniref:transmembrane protein 132E-like n=1 Tax=Lytechinus pictus TaxID=7653 RepID=UPI0030BA0693
MEKGGKSERMGWGGGKEGKGVVFKGEAVSRFTRHRHRREATIEDVQWDAINYTFYANQDVFLLKDNRIANIQSQSINNHTYWDSLFAEQVIGTPNAQRTLFKAGSGPFWVQKELFPTLPEPFNELNIQAHLLQEEIPPFAGSISVLFSSRNDNLFSSGSRTNIGNSRTVQPCFRAAALFGDEESSSSCTLQEESEHCVAKVPIPISWYKLSRAGSINNIAVSYTIFPATSMGSCELHYDNSISSREQTAKAAKPASLGDSRQIGIVTILAWDGQMDFIEEDEYVGLRVPSRRLGIGEHFVIPITINKNIMYTAGVCTIKAKAREGIAAVSVRSTDGEDWNTLSMVKQKSFAMVTAEGMRSVSDTPTTESPEENPLVFVMEFEVLNDTATHRVINWRVDCNLRGDARASRFSTSITVVSDNWIQAIVPIPQGQSIINTALLTGQEVTVTLDIKVVTFLGHVMDAAGHARCRSADTDILKVRRSCANVYVDGTETSGSQSTSVQVSLQGHQATIIFSVWVPELPLRLDISDSKLSTIRGWKVAGGRQDGGILEPEKMLNGDGETSKKNTCHLRYQQAKISVYTRFYAPNANSVSRPDGKRIYLFGEDMEQSITHLVKNQIKVADRSIARIEGTKIIAKSPGNTQIEVTNPRTKEILGESPLMVAADKVNIANMRVTLVSGMTLDVHDVIGQGSKVKMASITALNDLFVEHQEAVLDAVMIFDDGTNLALQDVDVNDYTVAITTLDPHIILESPDSMQAYPGLIAMGEGSTSIMLEISLPKPCMKRRRSNAIVYDLIPVNVTFNNPKYTGLINNDATSLPTGTNSLWRSLTRVPGTVDYGIVRVNFDLMDTGKKDSSVISSIPLDVDFSNIYPMGPGAHQNDETESSTVAPFDGESNGSSSDDDPLSGIEIGMYVLLSVFSLAILAFMVNCVMFMAKYRRAKRIPKTHQSVPYPQNWVMFGMQEEHPRYHMDPAENIPLRLKDEEEGSSRDEAIGTESEVSIERHSSEEGRRICSHGIEETSLMQVPQEHRASNESQDVDCGVVMDGDDNEDGSLEGLEEPSQHAEESSSSSTSSENKNASSDTNLVTEKAQDNDVESIPEDTSPSLNTNQSNSSCDVRLTLNPSDDSMQLKSGLEGMEFSQILNYLDNLKESCT